MLVVPGRRGQTAIGFFAFPLCAQLACNVDTHVQALLVRKDESLKQSGRRISSSDVVTKATIMNSGEPGCALIEFTLTEAGVYWLFVLVKKETLHGAPWEVVIVPSEMDLGHCMVSGEGLTRARLGETARFKFCAFDAHGNRLHRGGHGILARLEGQEAISGEASPFSETREAQAQLAQLKPILGVEVSREPTVDKGLRVLNITPNGPAAIAGLVQGEFLHSLRQGDGQTLLAGLAIFENILKTTSPVNQLQARVYALCAVLLPPPYKLHSGIACRSRTQPRSLDRLHAALQVERSKRQVSTIDSDSWCARDVY